MGSVSFQMDGRALEVPEGTTLLSAARAAGIYLPALCSHPSLPCPPLTPSEQVFRGQEKLCPDLLEPVLGCGLCVVEVDGEGTFSKACRTVAQSGLSVRSDSGPLRALRQQSLSRILAHHPHACLTCAQKEGCSRTQCSSNVPESERCCEKLGHCELEKITDYVGIAPETPRYRFADLPVIRNEPLFLRDYNLCIGCRRCVRACEQMRGVGALGFVWQGGDAVVGTLAPSLRESECRFCGACVEVCPTGALRDKVAWPDKSVSPCRQACPVGLDIPTYVRLIAQGELELAAAVIRQKLPFAAVLGRVCHRPCEAACRRTHLDEPVAVCQLKRFVADTVPWDGGVAAEAKPGPTGRRVAVVGAGPSGLTAAYFLAKKGHEVTVFEALPEPGGMLRYGLAEYRLPRDIVASEISDILRVGIQLRTRCSVSLPEIQKQGYDAVYLAAGASGSKKIPLKGSEIAGVFWGLDFLRTVRSGSPVKLEPPIVVIGGGNVAMDVALTALRISNGPIHMACLESRSEMPAFPREVEEALAEGILLHPSWGPQEVLGGDSVEGIDLVRCTSVFDENKRFAPRFDPSERLRLEARSVILAIGQTPDLSFLNGSAGSSVRVKGSMIEVEGTTLATGLPGVYAGGDVAGGIPAVVHAVAMGRKAAASMDRYLGGNGELDDPLPDLPRASDRLGKVPGFASRGRAEMPTLPLEERRKSFAELELGFDRTVAAAEALRCLRCDLRAHIEPPPFPPEPWLELKAEIIAGVPDCEGVIQLLNQGKEIIQISGTPAMRQALEEHRAAGQAAYFLFEEDKMFTQRESELLQAYLSQHGKLPQGNDLSDDLF